MRVVIVSHLFDDIASGPSRSVPSYADSLSKLDEVVWINTIEDTMPHWGKVACFHKASEIGGLNYSKITHQFGVPDIVVFQGFNFPEHALFAIQLRRKHIPYIIVPRGSLAYDAIHNHARWKKWVAHKLLFDRYVKSASAIQFLTKEEYDESGKKWNSNCFVLGNGFSNDLVKEDFSRDRIKGVFIGRLDMYHKGLDNLVAAVGSVADQMRAAHFTIDLYGPEKYDYLKLGETIAAKSLGDVLSVHGPVSGDAKSELLLGSDLFVLTSRFEGHPMGLIEALSYGLPALVTAGSNMMGKIIENKAGWQADPNTSDAIAETLLRIIKERESLKEKGRNARLLSLDYDWQALAVALHTELEGIVERNRKTGDCS